MNHSSSPFRRRSFTSTITRWLVFGSVLTILMTTIGATMPLMWTKFGKSEIDDYPVRQSDPPLRINSYKQSSLFVHIIHCSVSDRKMGKKPEVPLPWWSGLNFDRRWDQHPNVLVEAAGFPFPAFRSTVFNLMKDLSTAELNKLSSIPKPGIPLVRKVGFHLVNNTYEWPDYKSRLPWNATLDVIPVQPIWPGLLADTFILGAPFAIIPLLMHTARRAIRRRRGHCPNCNYNIRGSTSTQCPECGASICYPSTS